MNPEILQSSENMPLEQIQTDQVGVTLPWLPMLDSAKHGENETAFTESEMD